MSVLLAEPGFCWIVRYPFELPLIWVALPFLFRRSGPFIWMSNPVKRKHIQLCCCISVYWSLNKQSFNKSYRVYLWRKLIIVIQSSSVLRIFFPDTALLSWSLNIYTPIVCEFLFSTLSQHSSWGVLPRCMNLKQVGWVCVFCLEIFCMKITLPGVFQNCFPQVNFSITCYNRCRWDFPGQCDDGSIFIREQTGIWDRRPWKRTGTGGEGELRDTKTVELCHSQGLPNSLSEGPLCFVSGNGSSIPN